MDDLISKLTASTPQTFRADWMKMTTATFTANRWYDLSVLQGNPPAHGTANVIGEWLYNGTFDGGANGWTLGSQWAWINHTMARATGGTAQPITATMQKAIVAGMTYRVTWTISSWTAGTFTVSLGGASGTGRGSAATFVEYITAVDTTALAVTPTLNTAVATISEISVIAVQNKVGVPYGSDSLPLDDTMSASPYLGPNVSPQTKHVVNVEAHSANLVPGKLMLVDQLMVYAGINLNTNMAQTIATTLTLPRYTDGVGVRAYMVCTVANGATPQNIAMTYTNTVPTAGRTMPMTVASTASSVAGHLLHAGTNPNNFGPFLPMAAGDLGVKSVQTMQMSAAAGSGEAALVLCKPLLTLPIGTIGVAGERDLLNQIPSLPRVYDGANLQWLFMAGAALAAPKQIYGYLDLAWG